MGGVLKRVVTAVTAVPTSNGKSIAQCLLHTLRLAEYHVEGNLQNHGQTKSGTQILYLGDTVS